MNLFCFQQELHEMFTDMAILVESQVRIEFFVFSNADLILDSKRSIW